MRVTLLGTGTPMPNPNRFGAATLIEAGSHKLLIDAGRGVTIRLGQLGLPLRDVSEVFITHFHSDHLLGLADLWLIGWLPPAYGQREQPLRIWGPAGLSDITSGLEAAYARDIQIRIRDEQLPAAAARFDVTEFEAGGVVFDEDGVTVTAFEVDHGELIKPAFGYRIDFAGRSVVISGDTKFDENIIQAAEGVDLLIHEVMAVDERFFETNPRMKLVAEHHTLPREAGIVFDRVRPGLAVYSHIVQAGGPGIPPPSRADILAETRETYSGPLVMGEDLTSFEVGETVTVVPSPLSPTGN